MDTLEKLPRKDGTDRPAKTVRITSIVIYQDPFEEYKTRLAKKLARKAEMEQGGATVGSLGGEDQGGKKKREGELLVRRAVMFMGQDGRGMKMRRRFQQRLRKLRRKWERNISLQVILGFAPSTT